MRARHLLSVWIAAAALAVAACDANVEEGCLDGTCAPPGASSSGAGGAGGGAGAGGGGGAGGGVACLSCLPVGEQTGDLPCDVQKVLSDKCQRCHTDPPASGAPFPLLTYADTQAPFGDKPRFAQMAHEVETGDMPLTPPELTAPEKATLLGWLCACAPPAPAGTTCP